MLDHLRQMAIFARTIDHGSFRAAARAMNVSPSVVSHQVSQLEEKLGTALIYRSTRSLALTSDGEQLLSSARKMIEAAESGLNAISDQGSEPTGELKITMPAIMGHSDLINQFADFSAKHQKVRLNVDLSDTRKNLIRDGYDLAIRVGWLQDSALIARKLGTESRRLVAAKSYLETCPTPETPADLADWDWLELTPVRKQKQVFHKEGHRPVTVNPTSRISVNDAHALYQFVRAGAGLAFVPDFLVEADRANGLMDLVLPDWHLEDLGVYAVWPHNAPKHGLTRLLVNHLASH